MFLKGTFERGEIMRRWLKQIRIAQGIKQEEIADFVDISRGYYANIERGEKTPSVKVARKIAAYLKFDWTKFFVYEKEEVNL